MLINDPEAMYFPDKVKLRSNSASGNKVPKLNFGVFNKESVSDHYLFLIVYYAILLHFYII